MVVFMSNTKHDFSKTKSAQPYSTLTALFHVPYLIRKIPQLLKKEILYYARKGAPPIAIGKLRTYLSQNSIVKHATET